MYTTQRILVVDDEPNMCESLKILLQTNDRKIESVHSCHQAIKYLEEFIFDLVLLDIVLPGGDGYRLMDYIDRHCPNTSIIIITGFSSMAPSVNAVQHRVGAYFRKPFDMDELAASVSNILNQIQLERRCNADNRALSRKNQFLHSILDSSSSVSIVSTDLEENVLFWNRGAENILGYKAEEMIGRQKLDILYPSENEKDIINEIRSQILKDKKPIQCVLREVTKDQRRVWINLNLSPRLDDENNVLGILRIGKDITACKRAAEEQKQLEAQRLESERTRSIATLSGGIAHQFNNSLMVITGTLGMLEIEFSGNEKIAKFTKLMKDASDRMTQLTRQITAYASEGKFAVTVVSINEVVRESLSMIKHQIHPSTQVHIDLENEHLNVAIDQEQITMAFSAVFINASEAIEDKGVIRLITNAVELSEASVMHEPEIKAGHYACLSIEDNGKGMDDPTKSKIFDPFFTTKSPGRGLGMSAAYGIIKNHDGWMTISSELGNGSVVRIYLPIVEEGGVTAKEHHTGKRSVLLIESNKMVSDVNRDLLERIGHRVLEARTGRDAIDIVKTFDGDIDHAILDVSLPDMAGKDIYHQMMTARPNLKVIVSSGYSINTSVQEILDAGAQAFIQKPFTMATLADRLKEAMEHK